MSRFKFNTLGWHLTDDHGWRMEIPKYPLLTAKSAWRYDGNMEPGKDEPHGGYYTTAQMEEIVRYAAERHVTIIPAIDVPGHASEMTFAYPHLACDEKKARAAETLQAFPNFPNRHWKRHQSQFPLAIQHGNGKKTAPSVLCMGKESTFEFLRDVFDEVLRIFPLKIVDVCCDEVDMSEWRNCPHCRARVKEIGGADERALWPYVATRLARYLKSKGRTMICDDDVTDSGFFPKDCILQCWRYQIPEPPEVAAVRNGLDCLLTPEPLAFLCRSQSYYHNEPDAYKGWITPGMIYSWEPVHPLIREMGRERQILGVHFGFWGEFVNDAWQLEVQAYPRVLAGAEVVWSPRTRRDWNDFKERYEIAKGYLDSLGVDYYDERKDYHGWDAYDNDPLIGKTRAELRPDTPGEAFMKKARMFYPRLAWSDYRKSIVSEFLGRCEKCLDGFCWHRLSDGSSVRDVGGWNEMRPGRVYRASAASSAKLAELGVKTVVNLDGKGLKPFAGIWTDEVSRTAAKELLLMLADEGNYPVAFVSADDDLAFSFDFLVEGLGRCRETDIAIARELSSFECGTPVCRDGRLKAMFDFVKDYPGPEFEDKMMFFAEDAFGLPRDKTMAIRRQIARERGVKRVK